MPWRIPAAVVVAVGLVTGAALAVHAQGAAEHSQAYAPADIATGAQIYARNCMNCHGPNGTGIGGIDLAHGLLPRARTDAALQALVASGIAQSGMPAFTFSPDELRALVAYVRAGLAATDATPVPLGDAPRGRTIFEGTGKCLG